MTLRQKQAAAPRPAASGEAAVTIRPLGSADRARYAEFLRALEPDDLYQRMMGAAAPPDEDRVSVLLAPDGRRELALAAVSGGAHEAILGVARAVVDPADEHAEFALIVRSSCQGRGLGRGLLRALLERLRAAGVRRVVGHTFAYNDRLIRLAKALGFEVGPGDDAATRKVALALR